MKHSDTAKRVVRNVSFLRVAAAFVMGFCALSCAAGAASAASAGRNDLIFSINADIVAVDPAAQRDTVTGIVVSQLYDTLIHKTSSGKLEPGLATEWKIADDGLSLTFTIRNGVKFHNGDTMTAEDVAFSLNRAIKSSLTSNVSSMMAGASEVDGSHVRLDLKNQFAPVLECVAATGLSVVSKRAVEELGDDGFRKAPVGTGPYKFVSWKGGDRIIMTAFDDHWRGKPSIKDVTFLIMTDKSTAAIALQNDEIDVLYDPAFTDKKALTGLPNVTFSEIDSATLIYIISFNNKKGVFADKRLREAVAYAINRSDIVEGALEGNGSPVEMPISPTCAGFYDPSYKFYPQDVDKAKGLLKEAGHPDGITVPIRLNQSSLYTKPAEVVQAQLRKAGINVQFELMERATYLSEIYEDMNYEITLYMFSTIYDDPDYIFFGRLHSSNIGNTNYANYSNPEVDELIMKARSSNDHGERVRLYREISDAVKEDIPFIPLMTSSSTIASNSKLRGVVPSAASLFYVYDYSWAK
ncbi:MAG: ABC transporter substrate-binding protein [Synergistaceae bacterium]|jgi:peptide/nickel transport system substrate-binding protein|nr:ABC transporter substrate-binding protein [Synergistaceae bacterium]